MAPPGEPGRCGGRGGGRGHPGGRRGWFRAASRALVASAAAALAGDVVAQRCLAARSPAWAALFAAAAPPAPPAAGARAAPSAAPGALPARPPARGRCGAQARTLSARRSRRAPRRSARRASPAPIADLSKPIRLPVWPAWFGVVYIILDLLGRSDWGAWLEDKFGGRVSPMIFRDTAACDPFLLVAHHRHSFNFLDPLRYVFRSVLLPEGFPAHPHRGFETVTYVLRGGLVHRDSFGIKKSYGAPSGADGSGEGGAVQWMTAGSGILHEEMWRTGEATDSTDQELFQIWVNLPRRSKLVKPRMQMLGGSSGPPTTDEATGTFAEVLERGPVPVATPAPGVTVRVIAGSAAGARSPVETHSEVAILHVTLAPGTGWSWPRPIGWTCMLYMRRGSARVVDQELPLHHTAWLDRAADEVALESGGDGADVLLLAGAPLLEPVEMGANIVMNTPEEVAQANADVARGLFGPVWDHEEPDEVWRRKVADHWRRLGGGRPAGAG